MMAIALVSGLILGVFFFGGLWLTIKMLIGTPYAGLWFLASSLFRTAIVLTGFYFMVRGSLIELLISVAGFVAARFLVLRITKSFEQPAVITTEKGES